MRTRTTRLRPLGRITIAGALTTGMVAALTGALVAPAHAASDADRSVSESTVVIDAGNDVSARVNPTTGTVLFETRAGGASWDSSILETDRYGLGPGGTWGTASVTIRDGIRVYIPGMGVYEADQSKWSGLSGYPGDDLNFFQNPGTLPARGDIPAQEFVFTLHHLTTGAVDYFASNGEVVVSDDGQGGRIDRAYSPTRFGSQLDRITDAAGQTTTVQYAPNKIGLTPPDRRATTLQLSMGRVITLATPEGVTSFSPKSPTTRIMSTTPTGDTITNFTWGQITDGVGVVAEITRNGETVYIRP